MTTFLKAAIAASLIATSATPAMSAPRRDYTWRGDQRGWNPQRSYYAGNYRERRLTRNDRIYRGQDGRYYCRRNNGTTGLVIGGIAGGVLGNAVGGSTLATIIGAAGGAALGRSIDRGQVRCR